MANESGEVIYLDGRAINKKLEKNDEIYLEIDFRETHCVT